MARTIIIRHISECFIRPQYEVQDSRSPIYLTPEDHPMLSSHYIQKGLLFSKLLPNTKQANPVKTLLDNLKHSLSLALVHFYPLAGRFESEIDEGHHTTLIIINCNKGPGARFIHAKVGMEITEILSPQDVPHVVQSFFDHDRAVNHDGHTQPLLSVQVTELVDGVFIGCSMNHVCGDGVSYWNFFNTFSEIFMAHGKDIVISRPPMHKRWFIDGAGPKFKLPFTHPDEFIERYEAPKMRERIFHFSAESIAKLKAKANEDCRAYNRNISSFQALSALVWRCITRARCLSDDLHTRCKLAVNFRGRLNPPLSNNYFGNAIQIVEGESRVGELLSQNLGWAASLLHQAVKQHTDEKVRNVAKSWVASPFIAKIGSFFDPLTVHMGSSPRFNMYGNEFGMGKALAVLSGYANKFDGKIISFAGREGGGSVDLEICLAPITMTALELDKEFMEAVYEGC